MKTRVSVEAESLLEPGWHRLLIIFTALLVVLGSILSAGVLGVLIAPIVVATWIVLGTPFALATATVLLVPMLPTRSIDALLPLLLVLAPLAIVPQLVGAAPRRTVTITLLTSALCGGFVLAALTLWPIWFVGLLTLVGIGLLAYILHRYHLLQLGLLEEVGAR